MDFATSGKNANSIQSTYIHKTGAVKFSSISSKLGLLIVTSYSSETGAAAMMARANIMIPQIANTIFQ